MSNNTFGSGDNDIFAYDSNTLRMTQFRFNVGTQSKYFNGALSWNANGSLAIAVWNLSLPEEAGSSRTVILHFKGLNGSHSARVTLVDKEHGSPLPAWEKMGRPAFPALAQIEALRKAAALPPARSHPPTQSSLTLTLPPHSLALITLFPR